MPRKIEGTLKLYTDNSTRKILCTMEVLDSGYVYVEKVETADTSDENKLFPPHRVKNIHAHTYWEDVTDY